MTPPLLEVIVLGAADAERAASAGADRLELVASMEQGGLTPPARVVNDVVRVCRVPAMVMVRPHARSFVYDDADMAAVREAIAMARDAGAHGIVFGALDAAGEVDVVRLEQVLRWADGMPLTFHRAFDAAADLQRSFRVLGRYRGPIAQVLTSGGAPSAAQGRLVLQSLVSAWRLGEGVAILVGAGVSADNLAELHADVGATQYHVGSGARIGGHFDAGIDIDRIASLRLALVSHVRP